MKKVILIAFIALFSISLYSQEDTLRGIYFPDTREYKTLKCDFHMHTVFSDGLVWPSIRLDEAYFDGLDAFAFTEHIEYQPHKKDVSTDINRPYEMMKNKAAKKGIVLIHAAELTREMPPGHFNFLFIEDANALKLDKYEDVFAEAEKQNAFIFWNHPGWQQKDLVPIWYPEHTKLLKKGRIQGVEIYNEKEYYPLAFQWAIDSNLTIFGNSDIHSTINMMFDPFKGEHRPLTLVFAKEKTEGSIKEAMLDKRTAVFAKGVMYGREEHIKPLFEASVKVVHRTHSEEMAQIIVQNKSGVFIDLELDGIVHNYMVPKNIILEPFSFTELQVVGNISKLKEEGVQMTYNVTNWLVGPEEPLKISFKYQIIEE